MSTFLTFLKITGLIFLTILFFFVLFYLSLLPLRSLSHINPGRTAMMVEQGGPIRQKWIPLSQMTESLCQAVIAAEDGDFYNHRGIDFHEMRASFEKNLKKMDFVRGFSTITMQVAKNLYLSRQKTIGRKILEIVMAVRLEQVLSKNRILEIYLNVIEWGDGVYGVEEAAKHYFGKSAAALSYDESAFLAAIIPNPRKWGRYPPGPYVQKRSRIILTRIGAGAVSEQNEEHQEQERLPEEPEAELPYDPTEPLPEDL